MKRTTKSKSFKQTPSVDTHASVPENGCLVIDHKDLGQQCPIGTGFYANVNFGIWRVKNKNQHVAIKCLKEEVRKDLNILESASNMSRLKNDHIMKFYGICGVDKDVKLVMEYARHGSLKNVMRDPNQRKFFCQHARLKDFAVQISHGMDYLANEAQVHCNLAAKDVLVVDKNLVRIRCDFAIPNALGQRQPWSAPEVIQNQIPTIKSDVYSYGVVLWEMMTFGEDIGKNKVLACQNENLNDIPDKPRGCPASMYELMHACLSEKPDDRPAGFKEITCALAKIVYQVGSSTFKVVPNKSGYLSFNINRRMTLIERLTDTEWLAQDEDADVGIVREDHVNLKIKPRERSLPAQISKPFDPVHLSSGASAPTQRVQNNGPSFCSAPPIPPRHDLDLLRSRPIPTPDQLKDVFGGQDPPLIDFSTELQATGTLKHGDRANREENRSYITGKGHSSNEENVVPEINPDHTDRLQKEDCKPNNKDRPLIYLSTSAMPLNSDGQGGRTQKNETFPLIDLSEEHLAITTNAMEVPSPRPCTAPQSTTVRNEHNSVKNILEGILPKNRPQDSNHNTDPFSANQRPLQGFQGLGQAVCNTPAQAPSKGSDSHEQEERENIYQVPFHTPIPSRMPPVDPERRRQPPPSPAYGRETDALIARLQEEFNDLSRDECYARLLHYNHDIELIIKILKVKDLANVDEDCARFHLGHCRWDVERAVNYILSKTE